MYSSTRRQGDHAPSQVGAETEAPHCHQERAYCLAYPRGLHPPFLLFFFRCPSPEQGSVTSYRRARCWEKGGRALGVRSRRWYVKGPCRPTERRHRNCASCKELRTSSTTFEPGPWTRRRARVPPQALSTSFRTSLLTSLLDSAVVQASFAPLSLRLALP